MTSIKVTRESSSRPADRNLKIIQSMECTLLAGDVSQNPLRGLYQNAFRLWKKTWEKVIFPEGFVSDSFFHADQIIVLHKSNDVGALAVINFYDLTEEVYRHSSYLKDFQGLRVLESAQSLMTIEYICADPSWRGLKIGFGNLLIGLAQRVFEESGADVWFGTARVDVGIDKLGPSFGFSSHGEINRYGLPCALMVNSRETNQVHPDQALVRMIHYLWNQRNGKPQTMQPPAALKIVA